MGRKVASVYGPYPNGGKWRVVLLGANGQRKSKVLDTYEEAQLLKCSVAASLSDEAKLPMAVAIDEFLAMKRKHGLQSGSLRCWANRLAHLPQDLRVAELSPTEAQALYDRWTGELAAASHRALLRAVRSFFAWTMERGYLAQNPFARVKPVGKPKRGKPQPRVDEARKLYSELFRLAWGGDSYAGCLLVQILLGPRSSEIWGLRVRDVDADGMRLLVAADGGKTANATRTLAIEVPELRDLLLHFCQGKEPTAYLFSRACAPASTNTMLHKYLRRLCTRLNVPQVCPHSLRGLHATLAVQAGATSRAVAAVLGHGSDEVTKRHYIAPGADKSGTARNLAALLAPSEPRRPQESPAMSDVLAALLALPPEDRRAILRTIGEKL